MELIEASLACYGTLPAYLPPRLCRLRRFPESAPCLLYCRWPEFLKSRVFEVVHGRYGELGRARCWSQLLSQGHYVR